MSILSDSTIHSLCTSPYRSYRTTSSVDIGVLEKAGGWFNRNTKFTPMQYCFDSSEDLTHSYNEVVDRNNELNNNGHPMISPFVDEQVRVNEAGSKIISYGLTSYGYDVRLKADEVKVFTNANGGLIDPMRPCASNYIDAEIHTQEGGHKYFVLPPNSYALAATREYFRIPRNVLAICVGKSTYARSAVQINCTPIEPEFEGEVVIEIANSTTLPVKVYLETGIAQFLFFYGDRPSINSYADGNRKYQGQTGVTLSKV